MSVVQMYYNKNTENKLKGINLEKKYIESFIPRTEITSKIKIQKIKEKKKKNLSNKPKELSLNYSQKTLLNLKNTKENFFKTKSNSVTNIKFTSNNSLKKIKKNYEYKLNPKLDSVRINKNNYEKNQERLYNQNKTQEKFIIQEKIKINILQKPQIKFESNDDKYRLFKLFKGFGNITRITFSNLDK